VALAAVTTNSTIKQASSVKRQASARLVRLVLRAVEDEVETTPHGPGSPTSAPTAGSWHLACPRGRVVIARLLFWRTSQSLNWGSVMPRREPILSQIGATKTWSLRISRTRPSLGCLQDELDGIWWG